MLERIFKVLFPILVMALLASGCKDDDPVDPGSGSPAGTAPAFSLVDVNPTSATYDQPVSPRDHLERVSAWYFGHAT
jgi:hypothetical protein